MTVDTPPAPTSDITVNLEGLWLLQAMLGISQLAPELRGRPYGQAQNTEWAQKVSRADAAFAKIHALDAANAQATSENNTRTVAVADRPSNEIGMRLTSQGPFNGGDDFAER